MLQAGALLAYGPVWFLVGILHLRGRSHGGVVPDFLTGEAHLRMDFVMDSVDTEGPRQGSGRVR